MARYRIVEHETLNTASALPQHHWTLEVLTRFLFFKYWRTWDTYHSKYEAEKNMAHRIKLDSYKQSEPRVIKEGASDE